MKASGLAVLCFVASYLHLHSRPSAVVASQSSAFQATTADKPRVFITDSQSWEISGSGGGANGAWGAQTHGGARPQTAEIIKTFGERCPQVMVNNKQDIADYIVLLDHEGGKSYLQTEIRLRFSRRFRETLL